MPLCAPRLDGDFARVFRWSRTPRLRRLAAWLGALGLVVAPLAPPAYAATSHVVQPGETLSDIAASVGVDSATLARLNGLDDANIVVVGQSIQLPAASASASAASGRTYTVADGDTLSSIAAQLGTTTAALVEANKLADPDHLALGTQLALPAGASPGASKPSPSAGASAPPASPAPAATTAPAPAVAAPAVAAPAAATPGPTRHSLLVSYTVQPGETLNQIARQFDVRPDTVVKASGLDDPNRLPVGTVLKVPLPGHEHVVQPGETLHDIAAQEKVDLGSLVDFNELDNPELIRVGQVVLVPVAPTLQAASGGTSAPAPASASANDAPTTNGAALPADPAPKATPPPAANPPAAPSPALSAAAAPATPAASAAGPPPAAAPAAAKPAAPAQPAAKPSTPAPAPRPAAVVAPPAGAPTEGIAGAGLKFLGSPYVWGGSSPSGFDCSGFVWYVARQAGKALSRGMLGEFNAGAHPARDDLKPGDLVFFQNTYSAGLSHNGIYIGNGQFVHAADERAGVTVSSLGAAYWSAHWFGATRLS